MEAEQMQKDEQLRRRDPKAHMAMISERKERDLRLFQRYAPSQSLPSAALVYPTTSTQPVCWHAPMVATGDMLRLPSTAPEATLSTGSMLYTPVVAENSAAVSPNLDLPESGPLPPSYLNAGRDTSVPTPQRMQLLVDSERLSETPKLTSHDLQKHVEDSVTFLANKKMPQLEEALGEAISNLFGNRPSDGTTINNGQVPKALRKPTREEIQAIISMKCSENKYEQIPDSLQLSYARQLRSFISQEAKTEEEYRHLASGVKHLLDKESVDPKTLLKVLGNKLRPVKPDPRTKAVMVEQILEQIQEEPIVDVLPKHIEELTKKALPAAEQKSGPHKSGSDSISGVNVNEREVNRPKEVKGARKRSVSAYEEHARKKARRATVPTRDGEAMEKIFDNLLNREDARSSKGGH